MDGMTCIVDIEDATGTRLGSGPIVAVLRWSVVRRLDKAGTFSFVMPADDPKAALVVPQRVVGLSLLVGGAWQYVGGGIIDSVLRTVGPSGQTLLTVSGNDLLRELTRPSMKTTQLGNQGGPGYSHAVAVDSLAHYYNVQAAIYPVVPWTFVPDPSPPFDTVYAKFAHETVLAALSMVAQRTNTHFALTGKRQLTFASTWSAAGIRALRADEPLAPETCAITEIGVERNTADLVTAVYPFGAGNAEGAVTLYYSTAPALPAGVTLVKTPTQSYLAHTGYEAANQMRIERAVQFREIAPLSNTAADLQAAANMLRQAALTWLQRRSREATLYTLTVAGCSALLRPLQTIRVVYRDERAGLAVDADLAILEAEWAGEAGAVRTVRLVVSDTDSWPESDAEAVAQSIQQGRVYQAHPQMNANSYVVAYAKNVDETTEAQFRFRFDDDVWQIVRTTFDFQLLPLESTVKSVAAQSVTSSSGGGSTQTSSSGGGQSVTSSSGGGSTQTSSADGNHTHTVTLAAHTHGVTVANHTHTVQFTGHAHYVNIAAHTHSVTVPGHSHNIRVKQVTFNVSNPVGMDGPNLANMEFIIGSGVAGQFNVATTTTSNDTVVTSSSGGGQTATSDSGLITTLTSSSGGGQTVTSSSGGGSTPTSASGGSHSHSVTIPAHTHSVSIDPHTHDITIPAHTHTVTPTITTQYGIFRDSAGNVFSLGDLEYSLDSSTWFAFVPGINGYANLGGGWNRIDITALISDAGAGGTFTPLQSNWLLRIRRKSTGATGKMAGIDAQLTVRSVIRTYAFN